MKWWINITAGFVLVAAGAFSHKYGLVSDLLYFFGAKSYVYNDIEQRAEASPDIDPENTLVILIMGQSNAGNHGESLATPQLPTYNYFDGNIYKAQDPLLGASGFGGSIWTRFADIVIANQHYQQVLIVPVAIGATTLVTWAPGGKHHTYLVKTLEQLKQDNIGVSYAIWQQGESDNSANTSSETYKKLFTALLKSIRIEGFDAPMYIAQTSRCGRAPPNDQIRNAQQQLAQMIDGVEAGIDTDLLGFEYRFDGCHFTTQGLQLLALRWYELIFK
jgi:hypothetical protein